MGWGLLRTPIYTIPLGQAIALLPGPPAIDSCKLERGAPPSDGSSWGWKTSFHQTCPPQILQSRQLLGKEERHTRAIMTCLLQGKQAQRGERTCPRSHSESVITRVQLRSPRAQPCNIHRSSQGVTVSWPNKRTQGSLPQGAEQAQGLTNPDPSSLLSHSVFFLHMSSTQDREELIPGYSWGWGRGGDDKRWGHICITE